MSAYSMSVAIFRRYIEYHLRNAILFFFWQREIIDVCYGSLLSFFWWVLFACVDFFDCESDTRLRVTRNSNFESIRFEKYDEKLF